MANVPTHDWAWPALIQSLQHDILALRSSMDEARRETAQTREQHRRELDALIEQLRDLRNDINPVVKERQSRDALAQKTRWAWIERAGWVVMGGIALAVWEFLKRQIRE
jgi:uncharacterized membrane protein YccC